MSGPALIIIIVTTLWLFHVTDTVLNIFHKVIT